MKKSYHALNEQDYANLIFNTPLNAGLKKLFNPVSTQVDYEILEQFFLESRQSLIEMGQSIIQKARSYPVAHVPLIFILDHTSSSGGRFLRWRNLKNNKSGEPAYKYILQDETVPAEIKQALVALENDRIAFNMQMSVLNSIVRQLRECKEKNKSILELSGEYSN
ncbi:hypothetical protein CEP48_00180 [Mergibacter septicus]|uniref:Uncharacterized protein n=1 Tax=Mergibacter septicus TaxID=221402 RepID=A0A8E3MEY9_9PAST|nr:DUF3158 family protein [Mergibacter septicus]AWX14700.1 hypothetical protein CEP47_00180 [Mergibacter septicus]QDJ13951.1 hypothetical protein CEP48_00180 [Mergibacter septicus]UTU48600.1 DUF3158 family protein [Mergibacter septicus]WMR95772.1 DUF3158 family protein [Mergibacter septicus]